MQKKALSSPLLITATGNLANFEKTSENYPIKDEFLATTDNFGRK